jgi:hypothetical protein
MSILDLIESELQRFQPRNQAEFVALQLAKRFDDLHRLPRYILAAQKFTKQELYDAANVARLRHQLNRAPLAELFFEVLAEKEVSHP